VTIPRGLLGMLVLAAVAFHLAISWAESRLMGAALASPHFVSLGIVTPIAGGIVCGAELDLQKRTMRRFCSGCAHRIRLTQRHRKGGGYRSGLGEAGQLPDRPTGFFRFQIPKSAVERVTGSARSDGALQGQPVAAALDKLALPFDRGDHTLDAFAIARIGHTFAAATVLALDEFRDDDSGFGLGAAADRKGARNRPAFDMDGENRKGHRGPGIAWEIPIIMAGRPYKICKCEMHGIGE